MPLDKKVDIPLGSDEPKQYYLESEAGKAISNPSETGNYNTGSGAKAAEGLTYSWQDDAAMRANITYKSDVLQAKTDALANKQELNTSAQSYQMQADMQKYTTNQSIEKAGWAGGYVLDANRQMEYMKATIQASMYTAIELQKYGYESQLQAARLAYDMNMLDLSREYYAQAQQAAINEAQLTGILRSPEMSDHLAQYNAAKAALANTTLDPNGDEYRKALNVVEKVDNWFKDQGLSSGGVATLAKLDSWLNEKLARQGMVTATLELIEKKGKTGIEVPMVNADGSYIITDDGFVKTINLVDVSSDELMMYLESGGTIAEGQVKDFVNQKGMDIVTKYFDNIPKNEDGTFSNKPTQEGLNEYLKSLSSTELAKFLSKFTDDTLDFISDEDLVFSNTVNGYTVTIKLDKTGKLVSEITGEANETTGGATLTSSSTGWGNTKDEIYLTLKEKGISYGNKNVIDVSSENWKSIYGNDLKQSDFNADKSKGKAGAYIDAIVADAKAGKIPLGAIVQLNYGSMDSDGNYTYMYVGDGKFAKVKAGNGNNTTSAWYVPEGYRLSEYSENGRRSVYKK